MAGNFTKKKLNPIRYAMSMTVSLPHGSVSCRSAEKGWGLCGAKIVYIMTLRTLKIMAFDMNMLKCQQMLSMY